MEKVKLNVEMLAWQYRVGHEEAMREAMKPHGIEMDNWAWENISRVILTSREGVDHSVYNTNFVLISDCGIEIITENEFVNDYIRV